MGLVPRELEQNFLINDTSKNIDDNIMSCIECGCCSYICPSRRLLAETIKAGKKRLQFIYLTIRKVSKMKELINVTFAPHVRSNMTTSTIMLYVIAALMPSVVLSVINYGLYGLTLYGVCVSAALLFEHTFCVIQGKKSSIKDLSAVVTGLLFAMTLPPTLPLWTAVVGVFFAIVVGKMVFGGIGQNPFNPALTGRMVLLVSFPALMTSFQRPVYTTIDALSGATILGNAKTDIATYGYISHFPIDINYLLFTAGGSLGEISLIALIIGGLLLLYKQIISWHIPVTFIGTVFIFTFILNQIDGNITISSFHHVFSGGLLLGAFFMATDYSISPMFIVGKIIFGIGCGFLTVIIRVYGGYPEGVGFAILIMNAFVPMLDKFFRPNVFGDRDEKLF